MTRETFFEALSDVDGALVAEAAERPKRGHIPLPAALAAAGALAACLALAAAWVLPRAATDGGTASSGTAGGGTSGVLGSFTPELMVDGRTYYWSGMASRVAVGEFGMPEGMVTTVGDGSTCLPAGYTEYGELVPVGVEELTGDCQLRAEFEASGTIYTVEAAPEAVYVRMTTSWFEDEYVRFVSGEILNGARIRWEGRDYMVMVYRGAYVRELPEGCEELGVARFIGEDVLPRNDLETNCVCDDWSRSLNGRTVYAGPSGQDVLYIYETGYWREGSFDAWIPCVPWEQALEDTRQQILDMGGGPGSPGWPK